MVKKIMSRGSAMLAVLVFITLVIILGVGILALSDATVKQSRILGLSDSAFYSAESALQVYVQLVEERVSAVDIISDAYEIVYSELDDNDAIETWRSDHLTDIKEQLQGIYYDIRPDEGGSLGIDIEFYLGDALLNVDDPDSHPPEELAFIGDTRDRIKHEFEAIVAGDPGFDDSYMDIQTAVVFYPKKAITYSVTATMSGRTLVANVGSAFSVDLGGEVETSPSGKGDALPDFDDTVFLRPEIELESREEVLRYGTYDGGAYYHANNTNVYSSLRKDADGTYIKEGLNYKWDAIDATKKNESYNSLIDQLKLVISEVDALTRDRVLGNIPATDPRWSNGTNTDAQYIRATGNYTMSGNYPNLEYLEVVGNLTISGKVDCYKLKGVYVGGVSGTNAITILESAQLDGNRTIGGTIFLTKNRDILLNTGSSTTLLYNGKFLASGGNVTISVSGGGMGNNKSNSMFVATKNGVPGSAKGKLTTTGQNFRMAAYSLEQVPQYYAENDLLLHVQNANASFEGIFATLSERDIFDGTVGDRNLKGLYVGNCSRLGQNVRILPFNPEQENQMLPGGLFDAEGYGFIYVPGEIDESAAGNGSLSIMISELKFSGDAKLIIRETTGDRA